MEQQDTIELIVVFKKTVEPEQANEILDKTGVVYREGMDSSRGKVYFYSTGPKYILTFKTDEDKQAFIKKHKGKRVVHEMYTPDWTKAKD